MNQLDSRWLQIVRILFLQFFRSGWWHGKDTKFSFMSTTCMMGQVHDLVASTCLPPNLKIAPKTSRFLCKDGLVEVLGGDRRGIFWCCNRHHWGWPNTFWALWISPPQQKKQKQCHYFSCPGSLFSPKKNNLISSTLLKHNNMCFSALASMVSFLQKSQELDETFKDMEQSDLGGCCCDCCHKCLGTGKSKCLFWGPKRRK